MLEVRNLAVRLDDKTILHDVDLGVTDGETVAVLGPSGSGKSTLLRAIAGLVPVAAGSLLWDGRSVLEVPTHLRGFGLMFQGYALFPHLDVAGNVGFGLRMMGLPAAEVVSRVESALEGVGLAGLGDREIAGLSGGERQRVALARTLAPEPALVMLDEPLGALDRTLRERLMSETREILVARHVTALVVTHDREEAVAMSDRLALMRDGTIVQTGSLDEILTHPAEPWILEFLG